MSESLSVRGLSAGYANFRVLHEIDLDVAAGSLTTIIGPNGAGKTTLLKALVGLLPYQGEVRLGSAIINSRPTAAVRRGLAVVAEGRQLFPRMTVRENLELGGYTLPRADRAPLLKRVFGFFPKLHERQTQYAGTMSGGEQQMLAVGRALMCRPRLILLDEPSLGLAPRMIDELLDIVCRIREDGVTVLLVEQNVGKALSIADYAIVMERGRFVAQGSASTLLHSDLIQAAYLGRT